MSARRVGPTPPAVAASVGAPAGGAVCAESMPVLSWLSEEAKVSDRFLDKEVRDTLEEWAVETVEDLLLLEDEPAFAQCFRGVQAKKVRLALARRAAATAAAAPIALTPATPATPVLPPPPEQEAAAVAAAAAAAAASAAAAAAARSAEAASVRVQAVVRGRAVRRQGVHFAALLASAKAEERAGAQAEEARAQLLATGAAAAEARVQAAVSDERTSLLWTKAAALVQAAARGGHVRRLDLLRWLPTPEDREEQRKVDGEMRRTGAGGDTVTEREGTRQIDSDPAVPMIPTVVQSSDPADAAGAARADRRKEKRNKARRARRAHKRDAGAAAAALEGGTVTEREGTRQIDSDPAVPMIPTVVQSAASTAATARWRLLTQALLAPRAEQTVLMQRHGRIHHPRSTHGRAIYHGWITKLELYGYNIPSRQSPKRFVPRTRAVHDFERGGNVEFVTVQPSHLYLDWEWQPNPDAPQSDLDYHQAQASRYAPQYSDSDGYDSDEEHEREHERFWHHPQLEEFRDLDWLTEQLGLSRT